MDAQSSSSTGNALAPVSVPKLSAFCIALLVGVALRVYCIVFTSGTGDLEDWQDHAQQVFDRGLIGYYHANSFANHPPFISKVSSWILHISTLTGIPFRILFRVPFALLDAGNALLLFLLLPESRWRYLATACYWLSPAAIIISAYHGNTDTAVPFLILVSTWLAVKKRTLSSGAVFGTILWVKLPGILALPSLLTLFRRWQTRVVFLSVAAIAGLITYVPSLIEDWRIVWTNVFGYRGLILQTSGGVPLWGPSVLLFATVAPIQSWPDTLIRPTLFILENGWLIALVAILILAWFRKDRHSIVEVCATIGMAYTILFGFSDNWAFQYFAWGLPFWFFLRWWFAIPAAFLTSAYLYSLHWLFCGNGWLRGAWDFAAHPTLPFVVLSLRNVSVVFFLISACVFLVTAIRRRPVSVAALELT